jgi:hypothetical protein
MRKLEIKGYVSTLKLKAKEIICIPNFTNSVQQAFSLILQ